MSTARFPARHVGREPSPIDGSAYSAALDRANRAIGAGGIVSLIGPRGTGKTQMAVECARALCAALLGMYGDVPSSVRYDGAPDVQVPRIGPLYTKALDLFMSVRESYRRDGPSEREVRDSFVKPRFLVIDEIQERGDTAWEDRVLVNIIDHRYDRMLPTMLIGNLKPEALAESLGSSIASRMQEGGDVIVCDWASFRARRGGGDVR